MGIDYFALVQIEPAKLNQPLPSLTLVFPAQGNKLDFKVQAESLASHYAMSNPAKHLSTWWFSPLFTLLLVRPWLAERDIQQYGRLKLPYLSRANKRGAFASLDLQQC